MRALGPLLLLLICQVATSIPISDGDDGVTFHNEHRRYYRSPGVGETIREWFKEIKDRIMGKWQEWFGNDGPGLSPQDFFNIDKSVEGRVSSLPGLFVDLWNEFHPDDDSVEWDIKSLMPNLPFPSMPGIDWKPKHGFGVTRPPPTTTPRIELTTLRPQSTQTTQTTSTVTTTEPTVITSAETTPFTTQSITTSTESMTTATEEFLISRETLERNNEPVDTVSVESTVPSNDSVVTSAVPRLTSIASTAATVEPIITTGSTVISTEGVAISTIESSVMSTEPIVPLFNKRIEDNEIEKSSTKKPRPISAEVIM